MAELDPVFLAQRPRLLAIAYRMLGSAAAAEDIVQEAWLRVRDTPAASVGAPEALLRTVVVRLCLDELKSARQRRESYVGPWLPEPVRAEPPPTPPADDRIDELESLSMAFLLVLEALSPLERAAFLLREVFDYGFDELAVTLGRSPAACRQLCHRARTHVEARRARFPVPRDQHLQMLQAFLAATASGDVGEISQLLCSDAVVTSDSGGEVRAAARKPIIGRDRVARFLVGVSRRGIAGTVPLLDWLNGCPAVLFWREGRVQAALLLESDGQKISAIRFVLAPSKLRGLQPQGL